MDMLKIIGANVRAFRQLRNLTQEELAKKAKLHKAYIGFVERGERNISVDTIVVIADALGVAPWVLLLPDVRKWL